ncbi:MAG: aminotransferase class IV [Candidatus Nanopelagicales bacterium]
MDPTREAQVFIDGKIMPASQAKVNVSQRAFTSGDGIFETLKVIQGEPFALTRHLKRLSEGARRMRIELPHLADLAGQVRETVSANSERTGPDARFRITVSAGESVGTPARGDGPPTIVMTCDPLASPPESTVAITVPWPVNERGFFTGVKTTSYAENYGILLLAQTQGADEAIQGDSRGRISEGTTSNVVVEHEGALVTPNLETGCLPGVTRDLLIEWDLVVEHNLPMTHLAQASEVLLSSSTRDLVPVRSMDGRELPAPGPLGSSAVAEFVERALSNLDP